MNSYIVGIVYKFDAEDADHAVEQFADIAVPDEFDVNLIVEDGDIEELGRAVRYLIPTADWSEDNDGQLVIYTNLRINEDGELVLV